MMQSVHRGLEILLQKLQYKIWHREPYSIVDLKIIRSVVTFVWNKILK